MRSTRRNWAWVGSLLALSGLLAACSSSGSSSSNTTSTGGTAASGAASGTQGALTIGVVASETGPLASQWLEDLQGFKSAIAAENAAGGVNGHQLNLDIVDDASTPSGNLTAVQNLVENKHVFAVAEVSALANGGIPYLYGQHVPVVTVNLNPIVGTKPYTNVFGENGNASPNVTVSSSLPQMYKSLGCTNLASFSVSISQFAVEWAQHAATQATSIGLKAGYVDTSVTVGTTNFTPEVQAMQAKGVDCLFSTMDPGDNEVLIQDLKNQNYKMKAILTANSFSVSSVATSSYQDYQGVMGLSPFVPVLVNNTATTAELAALKKYGGFGNAPFLGDYDQSQGYLVGQLLIYGVSVAGANPTPAAFMTNLRNTTDYTAGGLMIKPVNFKLFGVGPANGDQSGCFYAVQVQSQSFKLVSAKPYCG